MAGPIGKADGSVSRRGLAGRAVVPGLGRRMANARSTNAGSSVDIGSGARIGTHRDMSLGYMALASHGGSCEHGCGDHCSRNKFTLGHSISPCGYEEPKVLAPPRRWRRESAIKGT